MALIPQRRGDAESRALAPFGLMHGDMAKLFGDFFGRPFGQFEMAMPKLDDWKGPWAPSMDVVEKNDHVAVRVEVAGVEPEDIDVSIENGILTVSGEKKEKEEHQDGDWHRVESRFGSFRRSVRLPENLDTEKVSADVENGVLVVTLQKSQAGEPRKIDVRKK